MTCIVQKYGGSSVADLAKINKIADMVARVKRQNIDVAVVVSAMGKTTNQLISLARELSANPPRREMDMLLSTGERTTMALLCIALHERGIDSVSLTGSQSGIITDNRHNDARVIEVRPFRVQDELSLGRVVVVSGFQGISYKKEITTLGRGGSDTTAVALAAALNADRCEIYSDIDGVYTADPAVVPAAKHLPELSYQVMEEMSLSGAKVLNAEAVQFAKEKQIAIYARSTFGNQRETVVRKNMPQTARRVQAVSGEVDITCIRLQGSDIFKRSADLLAFLEHEQIPARELAISRFSQNPEEAATTFVISTKNVYGWDVIQKKMQNDYSPNLHCTDAINSLSLIGEGISRDNTILLEAIDFLNQMAIPIYGIITAPCRISIFVPKALLETGIRHCHKKWIEN